MNLLFLTPAYAPLPGGGERYVRSLAMALVELGHQVTVVTGAAALEKELWLGTPGDTARTTVEDGITVTRCPLRPFPGGRRGLLLWRKLMVLLSALPGDQATLLAAMARRMPPLHGYREVVDQLAGPFDLVHAFNISWEYPLVVGARWSRAEARPFVLTPFIHLGEPGQKRVARNNTMDHQRRLLTEATAVLTLTEPAIAGIAAYGIPMHMAHAIGGGLDPVPLVANSADIVTGLGITNPFALFIGRASVDKGIVHALAAVAQLADGAADGDRPFQLVTAGQSTPEFERALTQLPAQARARVQSLGLVSETEKHSLLAQCRLLLLPSRVDSFGIVLLEAWAHGKPVVAAASSGIPGVVDDGKNGLLVPYANVPALTTALVDLWQDDALCRRLGDQGRQKVLTQYTWPHVAARVNEIYGALLAARQANV